MCKSNLLFVPSYCWRVSLTAFKEEQDPSYHIFTLFFIFLSFYSQMVRSWKEPPNDTTQFQRHFSKNVWHSTILWEIFVNGMNLFASCLSSPNGIPSLCGILWDLLCSREELYQKSYWSNSYWYWYVNYTICYCG